MNSMDMMLLIQVLVVVVVSKICYYIEAKIKFVPKFAIRIGLEGYERKFVFLLAGTVLLTFLGFPLENLIYSIWGHEATSSIIRSVMLGIAMGFFLPYSIGKRESTQSD